MFELCLIYNIKMLAPSPGLADSATLSRREKGSKNDANCSIAKVLFIKSFAILCFQSPGQLRQQVGSMANRCDEMQKQAMGGTGLEPVTSSL